ncbi:MAG: hypothetical protein R3E98_05480 [Gemmatimonadota bacterium]
MSRLRTALGALVLGLAATPALLAQAPPPDSTAQQDVGLQVRFRGRGELGGDWTRFRPCEAALQVSCQAGLLPRITPDLQFGLEASGSIFDRFFVDVDYEQAREFSAANTLNLSYRGRPGEFIDRIEVGDVSFDLPESRFLTQSIPAANLGIRATAHAGPVSFQTVFAQQQGDVESTTFRPAGLGGTEAFVRRDTLVLDDADYVSGQFYFLLDPGALEGYPHVDVLALTPADAPAAQAPGSAPIQLYRFEAEPVVRQQVEGYIQADAVAERAGDVVVESGWFRSLSPEIDYFVHPSGLWVGLRRPLLPGEMLAVTYIAATGDTIGDYNPERIYTLGGRPRLRLLKASSPNHQPGRPTWEREMRQIYRISAASDVDPGTIALALSVGELTGGRTFTRGSAGEFSYLRLFGIDSQSPVDQVDRSVIYTPAEESVGDVPAVPGTYLVFPTLRPFAQPPPLPSFGLDASEAAALLGELANPAIYDEPDPLERRSAGLFRLNLEFTVRSEGTLGTFSLGAFGIRDGSERLMLGDYRLRPGEDYLIDYDIGTVTLIDPQALFTRFPRESLSATWEQKSLFEIAPTTILGLGVDYRVGERGRISLLGMYQFERELVRRPQLGVESSAVWLGGVSADFTLAAPWLDRALARLPATPSRPSSLRVSGEVALSLPDPNTQRDVFLDDFDTSNELPLPRFASLWRLGSAPAVRDGAEAELPVMLGAEETAPLVWQHTWRTPQPGGDTASVFEGFLPQEIDQQLTVLGSPTRESTLRIAFGAGDTRPYGEPRWRSLTTSLSPTGVDLSRSEYLEFYVADGDSLTLIVDLGVVSEDAMFVDSLGLTSGVKPNGTLWGLGRLDQEADPARGEIWSDALDRFGVWGEGCRDQRGAVYRVGDPDAVCTAGNGRVDTEDLDGDGNLDTLERFVRYVVPLDDTSPWLVRSRSETGTAFRLYRIPLRTEAAINPAGLFTEADWRGVKQVRLTLAGTRPQPLILARPRIVGSRWVKRGLEGVLDGLAGDALTAGGAVEVAAASRVSDGDAYQPPPGVLEQLDDPTTGLSGQGVEFAERSLSLRYEGIASGSRAEVVQRFPQRPRNFFVYRQARLWALARRGDWGSERPTSLFVKIGSDADNFYLYRTRLPGPATGAVQPSDWLPELVIDFEQWIALRQQAEAFLIANPGAVTGEPLEFWSADSTYAVVLQDRARAPVLAAVRELSLGVWNQGGAATSGEVWFNELRLSRAVRTPGLASHVDVALDGGGVFETHLTISNRNPYFRQLRDEPEYFNRTTLALRTTLRLDRFVPERWGVDVPLSVTHTRSGDDPRFLGGTDLRTDQLSGLRRPADGSTRVGVSFRKTTPLEGDPWYGPVVEGLEASVGLTTSDLTTVTTATSGHAFDARIAFRAQPDARQVPVLPSFLEGVAHTLLPDAWAEALAEADVRWSPERLLISTAYEGDENRIRRFDQVLELSQDSLQSSTLAPRSRLETRADVGFRPFPSLRVGADWTTGRDLLDPADVVGEAAVQALLAEERSRMLGVDLGWETNRQLSTRFSFDPQVAGWLRTAVDYSTTYGSYQDANLVRRASGSGQALGLQRNVDGRRFVQARAELDPGRLVAELGEGRDGSGIWIRRALQALSPFAVSWQDGINVRLNRQEVDPGLAYQLGWIGLDGYRFLAGDTAAFLADRSVWTVGGGMQLPASLSLAVDFQRALVSTFDTRSDRAREDLTWPNVRLSFSDLPVPEQARPLLRRVTVSGGWVRRVSDRRFGGASEQRRRVEEIRVPLDASVAWAGILNTTYRGAFDDGNGTDPTGRTDRGGQLHSLALTSSFLPPWGLADRLIRPVSVSLRATYTRQEECRIVVGGDDCVPFVDQLNRSLSLTLDSSVQDMDLGLEFAYVDRRSFVGQRSGSTQFQLILFGQFQAQARLFADEGR